MKVTVNINGKKKLRIRDNKLADKFRHLFTAKEENTNETKKDNNLVSASMPLRIREEGEKTAGDTVMDGRYIDKVKREVNNIYDEPDGASGQESVSNQSIREQYLNTVLDSVNITEKDKSNSQSSGKVENNMVESVSHGDNNNKAADSGGKENTFYDELNGMDKKVKTFAQSAGTTFKNMWDELIIGGRKAKDPWDAIWLSFRNSALKSIGEILSSALFKELLSMFPGTSGKKAGAATSSGDSGGSFWDSIGGVVGTIISFLKPTTNTGTGTTLVSSDAAISKTVVDRIDKWQKEFRVYNDVQDINKTQKKYTAYQEKYLIK